MAILKYPPVDQTFQPRLFNKDGITCTWNLLFPVPYFVAEHTGGYITALIKLIFTFMSRNTLY
jgi:hypothetical protein